MLFEEVGPNKQIDGDMRLALMKRGAGRKNQQRPDNMLFLTKDNIEQVRYLLEHEGTAIEMLHFLGGS